MRRSLGLSFLAFSFSLISACGGGGGGGDDSPSPSTQSGNNAVPPATITRANAKQLTQAAFAPAILSNAAFSDISLDLEYFHFLTAGQSGNSLTVSYNSNCSNGGSYQIAGTVSAIDNTGDVTVTYNNCTFYYYYEGVTHNGSIQMRLQAIDGAGNPTQFEYIYKNYRTDYTYQNNAISSGIVDGSIIMVSANQVITSLVMTDVQNGVSISTNDFTSTYAANTYPYTAQHAGHVAHSTLGTVSINADANSFNTSFITGANQAKIRATASSYSYGYFDLSLDESGDGNYDSFASGYLNWFDEGYSSNTAPSVNVDYSALHPTINDSVSIPLNNIYDQENDFLSYSARVVESPNNVNINLTLTENKTLSFQTHGTGDYIIELTVNDGNGGVTTQTISMHISLPAPQVSPVYNNSINVGDNITINLQPSNIEAGPFTYKLSGAPAGMTIDGNGVVNWQATQSFFPSMEVQATISISNADHTIAVPLQFTLRDTNKSAPLARTNFAGPSQAKNTFVLDFNNDGSKEILTTDNSAALYSLKYNNGGYAIDWMYPYAIGKKSIDYIHPFDFNHNGDYEIAIQTGSAISVIDEMHTSTIRSADFYSSLSSNWYSVYAYGIEVTDIDNDGKQEIIAMCGNGSGSNIILVLDAETLTEKWRTAVSSLGNSFSVGNVDADNALEIATSGGYVFDGVTHTNEWLYPSQFGPSVALSDLNGDGVEEIIGISNNYSTSITAFSAINKSQLWQSSISYYSNYAVQFAQIDGDAAKEIIVFDYSYGTLYAYDATLAGTILKWSVSHPPTYSWLDSAVGDANADNSTDLILAGSTGLQIFDLTTRNISFTNLTNSYYSIAKSFIGGLTTQVNGVSRALFTAYSTYSYGTTSLIGVDLNQGTIQTGPSLYAYSAPDMCLADYDNDGTTEVFITASSNNSANERVTAFDFSSSIKEWARSSSNYSYSNVLTCNDFNGDGHTDVAGVFDSSLEINDPIHQNQIWTDTSNGSIVRVSSADLDSDGNPELITLDQGSVRIFKRNGVSFQQSNSYSIANYYYYYSNPQLSARDIDGNGTPEIIVGIQDPMDNSSTLLIVLNNNLTERSRVNVRGIIDTIAPQTIGNGQVLAAIHYAETDTQNYYLSQTRYRIEAIDVTTGNWVWRSPLLLSQVNPNSLHIHNPGTANPRLIIGTQAAAIITQ